VPGSGLAGSEPCVWPWKFESLDIPTSPMRSRNAGPYLLEVGGLRGCVRLDERT
jgi:hypothetical protein